MALYNINIIFGNSVENIPLMRKIETSSTEQFFELRLNQNNNIMFISDFYDFIGVSKSQLLFFRTYRYYTYHNFLSVIIKCLKLT